VITPALQESMEHQTPSAEICDRAAISSYPEALLVNRVSAIFLIVLQILAIAITGATSPLSFVKMIAQSMVFANTTIRAVRK